MVQTLATRGEAPLGAVGSFAICIGAAVLRRHECTLHAVVRIPPVVVVRSRQCRPRVTATALQVVAIVAQTLEELVQ